MCFAGWKESQRSELKMRLLIVYAVFLFSNGNMAFFFGVEKKNIVPLTKMPKWGTNVFNRVIGDCHLYKVLHLTRRCQVAFYLSFRRNNAESCHIRFNRFSKCYMKTVDYCFGKVLSGKALDDAVHHFNRSIWKYKKFQCGEVDYKPSKWFPEFPVNNECPREMPTKLDRCVDTWYKVFQKRPWSYTLCFLYKCSIKCVKDVLIRCKFDFSKSYLIFDNYLNPFCDKHQMGTRSVRCPSKPN